jgi:hypothetical protein
MEWSTRNSNNERGLLKSNGPYRLHTTYGPGLISSVRRSRIIKLTESVVVGEVKTYGATSAKVDNNTAKEDSTNQE